MIVTYSEYLRYSQDKKNASIKSEVEERKVRLVPYYKLDGLDKYEVIKIIEKSHEIEFFKIFLKIENGLRYTHTISAIVLVNENKIIGFHKAIKAMKDSGYRPGVTFIKEKYRNKGYYRETMLKYFEVKRGICWIDDRNTRKEKFFSSIGFKKTKNKATNYDGIELGTFWVIND